MGKYWKKYQRDFMDMEYQMILVRRRIIDERMTEVLITYQEASIYASEFIYDIEKALWNAVEAKLGLNAFRWDFPKHNQWIGWVE